MQPAVRVRPGQGGSQDSPSLYEFKTAGKGFFATLSAAEAGHWPLRRLALSRACFLSRFLADDPVAPGRSLVQVSGSSRTLQRPVDYRTILCGVQIKQAHGRGPTPLFYVL